MSDLASAILQCVWPIVDQTVPLSDLYAEAASKLQRLADQAHAVITGPPAWRIFPAADVIGWEAYAPGLVLIGRAPAEDIRAPRLRCHDIDDVEVDTARVRDLVPYRAADRYELVRRLYEVEDMDFDAIAARLRMETDAVKQIVLRSRRRRRQAVCRG